MKLRMIAEAFDRNRANESTMELALKGLQYSAMGKIRQSLAVLGLLKGGEASNHTTKEPIPEAQQAFWDLRNNTARAMKVAQNIIGKGGPQSPQAKRIQQFWGFQFPKDWYDVGAGNYGRSVPGEIDQLIEQLGQKYGREDSQKKVEALHEIAKAVSTYLMG